MLKCLICFFALLRFVFCSRSDINDLGTINNCEALKAFQETIITLSIQESGSDFVFLTDEQSDSVDNILKSLTTTPIQLMLIRTPLTSSLIKNSIVFILVHGENNLSMLLKSQNSSNLNGAKLILVFLVEETSRLKIIFETFFNLLVFNVIIVKSVGNEVVMISTEPFKSDACRNSNPIIINVFNKTSQKWINCEIFPKKMINFHRCPLKISTLEYPPAVMKTFQNGVAQFTGSDIEVINGLSSAMNFTVDLKYIADLYNFGQIFENGSSTGAIFHAVNGSADLVMGFYFLNIEKLKYLSNSNP